MTQHQPETAPFSIVRENLMTRPGYSPYCGDRDCRLRMPRTVFKRGQFECSCGWRSGFEPEFIQQYEARWASAMPLEDQK